MKNILEKLVDKITFRLLEEGAIGAEDEAAYRFGIEVMLLKAAHLLTYLLIAVFMRRTAECVVIFSIFCLFRRSTGGFHAQTRTGCYAFSSSVVFASLVLAGWTAERYQIGAIIAFDIAVLLCLSPVRNENRGLEKEEIHHFRRRLWGISILFAAACMAIALRGYDRLLWLCCVGISMNVFLTVLGKIQYRLRCGRARQRRA